MLRPILLAAALTLGACATPGESAGVSSRDCFRALDVGGYGVIDERRVRVHVSPQREYILTINQNVQDLDWTHAISIRSTTSFICVGNGLGVQVLGGDPPLTYSVVNIERAPANTQAVEGS